MNQLLNIMYLITIPSIPKHKIHSELIHICTNLSPRLFSAEIYPAIIQVKDITSRCHTVTVWKKWKFSVRCGNLRLFQFQGVAFIKNLGQVEIVHQEVLYKYQNKTSEWFGDSLFDRKFTDSSFLIFQIPD